MFPTGDALRPSSQKVSGGATYRMHGLGVPGGVAVRNPGWPSLPIILSSGPKATAKDRGGGNERGGLHAIQAGNAEFGILRALFSRHFLREALCSDTKNRAGRPGKKNGDWRGRLREPELPQHENPTSHGIPEDGTSH